MTDPFTAVMGENRGNGLARLSYRERYSQNTGTLHGPASYEELQFHMKMYHRNYPIPAKNIYQQGITPLDSPTLEDKWRDLLESVDTYERNYWVTIKPILID